MRIILWLPVHHRAETEVVKCIKNGDGEFGAVWALLMETAVSSIAYELRLQADIPGLQREMIGRCL